MPGDVLEVVPHDVPEVLLQIWVAAAPVHGQVSLAHNFYEFAKNPKAITYLKKIDANVPPNQTIKLDKAGNPFTYIDSSGNLVTETTEGTIIPLTENDTENVQNKINIINGLISESSEKGGGIRLSRSRDANSFKR